MTGLVKSADDLQQSLLQRTNSLLYNIDVFLGIGTNKRHREGPYEKQFQLQQIRPAKPHQ